MSAPSEVRSERVSALLRPRSIAILGASDRPGVGKRVVANLGAMGFEGEIFLINPNRSRVGGTATFPSLASLPATPDLVVVAVNREATVQGLAEASRRGCRAAVVLAAGFGEADDRGHELERELVQAIGHMAVMGPNCLGYVNLVDRIAVYSGPLMEPPDQGVVALISQSGALACTFTGAAAERGILFSHVITTGNQIDLSLTDYVRYMAQQPSVRVIACYVEGFRDGRALVAAMDAAVHEGKAVVVLKAGRSRVGGMAARTHTGALAGSASIQLSVWRQHGVLVAADPEEFLALIELCSRTPALPGSRVGILTISGGERLLIADAAQERGVSLANFTDSTSKRLAQILPEYASVANPLDTTGAGVVEGDSGIHREAATIVSQDPNVDILVACQDAKNGWTHASRASTLFHDCVVAAVEAAADAGKPLVVISPSTGDVDDQTRQYLRRHGVPFLSGLGPSVAALAQLVRPRVESSTGKPDVDWTPPSRSTVKGVALSGFASLTRLAGHGIDVWPTLLASAEDEAVEIAERFGYPVAMKIDGPGLQHRTEVGGVRTGVGSRSSVRAAWRELTEGASAAGISIDGVLLQPMAKGGVEVFVGGLRDEQFGPVVLCGPGGVLLELLGDTAAGLAPLDQLGALRLLQSTRVFRLLQGLRGNPAADIDKLVATVAAISSVVAMPDVLALDVNPLIALPTGLALVDAKLVVMDDADPKA